MSKAPESEPESDPETAPGGSGLRLGAGAPNIQATHCQNPAVNCHHHFQQSPRILQIVFGLLGSAVLLSAGPRAQAADILVQSTTSVENSGLLSTVLEHFTEQTQMTTAVVAVGSGQAIENVRRCQGDLLLSHAPELEKKLTAEGFDEKRIVLMYNDFVIVGHRSDPAAIQGSDTVKQALGAITHKQATFISRGDNSGTHIKERALWEQLTLRPDAKLWPWYLETGAGMGMTLTVAVEKQAYVLSDRATWSAFGRKNQHVILFENPQALLNEYAVITISPKRCPENNVKGALTLQQWLLSPTGQDVINQYRVNKKQVFFTRKTDLMRIVKPDPQKP